MNRYKIGSNSKINCSSIKIEDSTIIGDNVDIECEELIIGRFCKIGNNVKIRCRKFIADDWLYLCDNVEIGRGGCTGLKSNVIIGKHVGIFEKTIINPSDSVEIGDNVGIGGEVMIWTHGAWLDVLQGFPSDFGPVKIGKNVWLPARSIVLPNVTIGDNTVIGIGSIINRNLPGGCFAAGSPCKVIKENCYPVKLTDSEKEDIINNILSDWNDLIKHKAEYDISAHFNGNIIEVNENSGTGGSRYIGDIDINNSKLSNEDDEVLQDLRDYLRRRGIKLYTDTPFKSMEIIHE